MILVVNPADVALLDVVERECPPAMDGTAGVARSRGARRVGRSREEAVRIVIVLHGQPELLQVVGALHAVGGFANLLHGRQQQSDEDRDDGDDNEQFNESKTATVPLDGLH